MKIKRFSEQFNNISSDLVTDMVDYHDCTFFNVDFSECSIINVSFNECKFFSCSFENAYLDNTEFYLLYANNINLNGATLINSKIMNSEIQDSKARFVTIENSKVSDTRVLFSEFHNALFSTSHLINFTAKESYFLFARFIKCNIVNFKNYKSIMAMMEIDSDMDKNSKMALT